MRNCAHSSDGVRCFALLFVSADIQTDELAHNRPCDVRYALEGAGGVLGPWSTVTTAGPRKVTISGLTMAGIYHFQICAFGRLGYTDWMDTKTFICA
jgi:hypothetical protein